MVENINYIIDDDGNYIRKLYIHWCDCEGINHLVGSITQKFRNNFTQYIIEYFQEEVKKIEGLEGFSQISGCPYEIRSVFVYTNKTPLFLSERVPNPRRPDLSQLLFKYNMEVYDMFEYLRVSRGVCSDNRYFVYETDDASEYFNEWLHKLNLER